MATDVVIENSSRTGERKRERETKRPDPFSGFLFGELRISLGMWWRAALPRNCESE